MNDSMRHEATSGATDVGQAELQRGPADAAGPSESEQLAQVELIPAPRRTPAGARPRPVGPGRKERAYLQRIADAERELETAKLLERGTNRMLDRLEREAVEARRMERKLSFALGALQAQNQALKAQLEARGEAPRLGS